jgi:hypothetical protein
MTNYFPVIKANPEMYEKEKARVCKFYNEKYKNDEEFREKRKQYQKQYRLRKKKEKNDLSI